MADRSARAKEIGAKEAGIAALEILGSMVGKQALGVLVVLLGERLGRRAELDQDPVRIHRVHRHTPAVVDLSHVVAVVEPALLA